MVRLSPVNLRSISDTRTPRRTTRAGTPRSQERRRDGVRVEQVEFPRREDPPHPFGEEHIEVGLRPGRDVRGIVGPEEPDAVDLEESGD
ncbi:hypothetical protein Ae717Ps2_6063c [Pseudonocardia sp. Ae717_Ps2]|nr:hypothetical protein Ae717Ps2_6063c [Pseudonocardia sp. Ae717_Ps2]